MEKELKIRGFTLIEILVVLVLMSLVLAISAALLTNKLSGAGQRAAAVQIVSTLKYARHLAMAGNSDSTVLFDLDAGTFGIRGRRMIRLPQTTKIAIDEFGGNAEPITRGQYGISCDVNGIGQWSRIRLTGDTREIQIKPDPIRTAVITDGRENSQYE